MSRHIRSGVVVTRKDHKCWYCGEKIPKGTKAYSWTGVNEDYGISTIHTHLECDTAWQELYQNGTLMSDEGLDIGEYHRGSQCRRDERCECHRS